MLAEMYPIVHPKQWICNDTIWMVHYIWKCTVMTRISFGYGPSIHVCTSVQYYNVPKCGRSYLFIHVLFWFPHSSLFSPPPPPPLLNTRKPTDLHYAAQSIDTSYPIYNLYNNQNNKLVHVCIFTGPKLANGTESIKTDDIELPWQRPIIHYRSIYGVFVWQFCPLARKMHFKCHFFHVIASRCMTVTLEWHHHRHIFYSRMCMVFIYE